MKKFILFIPMFISILYTFLWYKSSLCDEEMAFEYLQKARESQEKQDDRAVMFFLNHGIKCCPHFVPLYSDRSRLFMFLGEYEKAIDDLTIAIQVNEENNDNSRFSQREREIDLYRRRGYIYEEMKQYQKALNDLSWVTKQDSTEYEKSISQDIHKIKGHMYFQSGLLRESLFEYEKSLEYAPLNEGNIEFYDKIVALSQIGLINFLLEKKKESIASFEQVIHHHQLIDQRDMVFIKNLPKVLFAYAQAYDYLSKSLQDNDDNKKLYQKYVLELYPNYNVKKYDECEIIAYPSTSKQR